MSKEIKNILENYEKIDEDDADLINVLNEHEKNSPNIDDSIYKITSTHSNHNAKFEIETKNINITLGTSVASFKDANLYVNTLFEQIYNDHINNLSENIKVRIVVFHDLFDRPCSTHLIDKAQFTPYLIATLFSNVVQSRKSTLAEALSPKNKMRIVLTISKVLKGGHRGKPGMNPREVPCDREKPKNVIDLQDYCRNKKSITVLKKSKFCLIQAILIAKAVLNREKRAVHLKDSTIKLKKQVSKIVQDLRLPNEYLGIAHIRRIEEYLQDYSIVCFKDGYRKQDPIYFNKNNLKKRFLYILLHNEHFYAINSITAYFSCSYYCHQHQVRYSTIGKHKCEFLCQTCFRGNCQKTAEIKCKCKTVAYNEACLKYHKALMCVKEKICNKCNFLKNSKSHVCLEQKYCHNCKKAVPLEHKCFILSYDQIQERDINKSNKKFNGLIFFDFEAYQCPKTGEHIVNLAVAQKVCLKCIDLKERCESCKPKVIKHNIFDFTNWMLLPENSFFIFIAHNAKGEIIVILTNLNIS
jgi:hypothetical protein